MFFSGSDRENLYFSASASKYIAAIELPSIAQPLPFMPPSFMLLFQSGIILFSSILRNTPSPVHFGHAPKGLLNENIRGDKSSMLTPCSGQAYFCEKVTSSPPEKLTTTSPPASFDAVSMLSARRDIISGLITRRSTTTSMLCFLFFSKGIFSDKS